MSLMSQLLKLNDKIEEIKSRVMFQRQSEALSRSSWSVNEISDSEYSDTDDNRIDFYNASTGSHTIKSLKSLSLNSNDNTESSHSQEEQKRKVTPDEGDIIYVYRKKHRKGRRRKYSMSRKQNAETDDNSFSDTGSTSDTDRTLSGDSDCSLDSVLENIETEVDDANDKTKSQKLTEPPKPRVGGISKNICFAKFHETNGSRNLDTLSSQMLTVQGHNIPLDKYYVPQGLVYLKHANAENVFCQFTH